MAFGDFLEAGKLGWSYKMMLPILFKAKWEALHQFLRLRAEIESDISLLVGPGRVSRRKAAVK